MRPTATVSRAGLIVLAISFALLARPDLLAPGTASSSPLAPVEPQATGETNLALGKPATQSSTAYDSPASRAVDGNTDGYWSNGSVSHTDDNYQAWWQVDLGSVYQVGKVDVYLMTVCCSSHQNIKTTSSVGSSLNSI